MSSAAPAVAVAATKKRKDTKDDTDNQPPKRIKVSPFAARTVLTGPLDESTYNGIFQCDTEGNELKYGVETYNNCKIVVSGGIRIPTCIEQKYIKEGDMVNQIVVDTNKHTMTFFTEDNPYPIKYNIGYALYGGESVIDDEPEE